MTATNHAMLTAGERLAIARTRADWKVGQMAEALDRHRNRISAYEATDEPPMWVIRKYAEVLDNATTVEWLAAEVGEPPLDLRGRGRRFGWTPGSPPLDYERYTQLSWVGGSLGNYDTPHVTTSTGAAA